MLNPIDLCLQELPLQEKRARYGSLGFAFTSIVLIADPVHSASDVITSVIVLGCLRAARRPADKEHPFGHGRVETMLLLRRHKILGAM